MSNPARTRFVMVVATLLGMVAAAVGVGAGTEPRSQLAGSNIRISGAAATSADLSPAVAYNPTANEYLVVWEDFRNHPTRHNDVYAQRVSATGVRLGSNVRVSGPSASDYEWDPAVAYNPAANQYLIVWRDGRNLGTRGWDIYGQRITAGGGRFGGNFRISGNGATSDENSPAVAYNPAANQYLVAWQDGRNYATRGWELYGQRVTAGGDRFGRSIRISGANAIGDENSPAVAYNPAANQYLVVWDDGRNYATRGRDIYGQRITAGGGRLGGNVRISGPSATDHESQSAVAYNPAANQYLVVWLDTRNSATRGSDVYGQRVSGTGSRIGGNVRISGNLATGFEGSPAVAYNPAANQYLVVWDDGRNSATRGDDIYGQRMSATGTRLWGNFRISGDGATTDDWGPAVAYNPTANQYLVVWEDGRNLSTRSSDIYGQRVYG